MVHVINPTPKDQPQNGVTQLCSTTDACQQTTTQPNPNIFSANGLTKVIPAGTFCSIYCR